MSATISALKGFMMDFIAGKIGYTINISRRRGCIRNSNSYRILSLNSEEKVKDKAILLT